MLIYNLPAATQAPAFCFVMVSGDARKSWLQLIHKEDILVLSGANLFVCMGLYRQSTILVDNCVDITSEMIEQDRIYDSRMSMPKKQAL